MSKIIDLHDIGLTNDQKKQLSDWFEVLMTKYSRMAHSRSEPNRYLDGVADGLNHAYKVVNNIEDDYMHV